MPFPIAPDHRFNESLALFRANDPFGLRRSITPVFVAQATDGRFVGCGTSFFIGPFGKQLSAMHVVTDFFNERRIPIPPNTRQTFRYEDAIIQILFDPGLFYGTRPAGTLLPVTNFVMFPVDQSQHPLATTRTVAELAHVEPSLDLVSWDIGNLGERQSEYLPLRIGTGPDVRIGDRVMAVGFPKNSGERHAGRPITTYIEEMFASIGKITGLSEEFDQSQKRWPRITVDTYWPPGMSGGPVFNETSEVIGIVSSGGESWSNAVWLQKLPPSNELYGDIDLDRPGWCMSWCACNEHSALMRFRTQEAAESFISGNGTGLSARWVSTRMGGQIRG